MQRDSLAADTLCQQGFGKTPFQLHRKVLPCRIRSKLVTFRLREGAEPGFVAANAVVNEWLGRQPGFLSRHLARKPDGEWIDMVMWDEQFGRLERRRARFSRSWARAKPCWPSIPTPWSCPTPPSVCRSLPDLQSGLWRRWRQAHNLAFPFEGFPMTHAPVRTPSSMSWPSTPSMARICNRASSP